MEFFNDLIHNRVLICALLGWFIAQVLKVVVCLIKEKKIKLWMLVSSGGMPSSHSATVCALATACAKIEGTGSTVFAIATMFAFIVMYDAAGVRRAVGQQAKILNRIIDDLFAGKTDGINSDLKELIGHTKLQVLMGAILGIAIGIIFA